MAPAAEEERKLVTVLFADVTGSTALGEQLDPERLREVMQEWFSAASAAIEAWGGTVEKFIGDAVVAVFGVPVLREDDAQRALHAALDMLDRLPAVNRRATAEHGVELNVRIGVNSGEVLAPSAGGGGPLVVGDAVNVAARLQTAAEPGGVLVGERTYLAGRASFRFGDPLQLELKGKATPVGARRLLGVQPDAGRGVPGLRAPMIGRDRELATLLDALEETGSSGRPSLVLVFGPAGLGKSRLLQEFVRSVDATRAAGTPSASVVRTRCLAVGRALTYWPLAELLRTVAGISLDEPVDSAQAKLEQAVQGALRETDESEMVPATVNALALTAGIRLSENPLTGMEPSAVADELGRAWPRFLSALAARGPLVVAIEDLHWASDELLVMLERILRRSSGPLLLFATARPEFDQQHPSFVSGGENVTRITLRPLSTRQGDELLDALLSEVELPSELRSEILERVEGNPFFLEEILRRMIDEGQLVHEADRWRLTDPSVRVPLPDTVLTLLASRIDALPASEKRVVQEASVIGRIFWEEPVRQLVGQDGVTEALAGLEGRGLVSVRPTSTIQGEVEYIFKHALVRDVAYASLPRRRRARAHAGVAAWTETLAGERDAEFLDLIAHHYGEAVLGQDADLAWQGDPGQREQVRQRAFDASLAAGAAARQRYHIAAAVERHGRALELARDDDERMRAYEALGDDHAAAFRGDEAWRNYRLVLDRAGERGDRLTVARIALRMASLGTKWGVFKDPPQPPEVERLVEQGLAAASARDELRARLLIERTFAYEMWHEMGLEAPDLPASAQQSLDEASEIAQELADPDLRYAVEAASRSWHYMVRDSAAAGRSLERSLELLPAVGNASARALGYFSASIDLRAWLADYDRALETARQAYEIARRLSGHETMHGTMAMMVSLYRLGRWSEIEPLLSEHRALFEDEADRKCVSIRGGLALGALLRTHQANFDAARQLVGLLGAPSEAAPDALVAEVHANLGEQDAARALLGSRDDLRPPSPRLVWALDVCVALADWRTLDVLLPLAREQVDWERLLGPAADRAEGRMMLAVRDDGQRAAAQKLLRAAGAEYDRLGILFEAARAREFLADAVDDPSERETLLRQALETYEALGAKLHARRVQA